jgi:hypothetical protein
MKLTSRLTSRLASASFALALSLSLAPALLAAEKPHQHDQPAAAAKPTPADAALIAKARASYPLKTCLVSDEPLGSMGESAPYIHRAAGQPDRVVFLCCDGCTEDFKASPAKFLAKVDAAAKTKK